MRDAVLAAVVIVLGGVFITIPAAFTLSGIGDGLKALGIRTGKRQLRADAEFIIQLTENLRLSGVSAIEDLSGAAADPFLRDALLLAAGGFDADTLRRMLAFLIHEKKEYFKAAERLWRFITTAFSVWGMLGALAGLALLEYGYSEKGFMIALFSAALGILLSQCAAFPVLLRVKSKTAAYARRARMITEGILSIKAGDAPLLIKEKLKSIGGLDGVLFD